MVSVSISFFLWGSLLWLALLIVLALLLFRLAGSSPAPLPSYCRLKWPISLI